MAKAAQDEPGCINGVCVAKIIFCPFILLWEAFRIYVLGCFGAYVDRLARGFFCGLCVCCNCTYKDKAFPHDHRSIGAYKGKSTADIDKEIVWRRIGDICAVPTADNPKPEAAPTDGKKVPKPSARLFAGRIEPSDICQGEVGDCWLMSALACLATKAGAIQQVFLTREYNMYGRYKLQLFNGARRKWEIVYIDDWIPCHAATGRPVFAKPHGDEAWVMLLEKAMAKFMGGSYAELDANLMIKAMEIMTGDFVCIFALGDPKDNGSRGKPRAQQRWTRMELAKLARLHAKAAAGDDLRLVYPKDDPFNHDLMFRSIKHELSKGSTIGASNAGLGNDSQNVHGIVQGHAYTLVQAEEVGEGKRFLQLRNPWGKFEWTGAWSDKSALWDQNPKIKSALKFAPAEDGVFWMEWEDFVAHFNTLEFCCRSTGFEHVVLDIHEEHPCLGPCWGCMEGCTRYWLCCLGCKALCCGRTVTKFERPPSGCCGCLA